MRVAVLILHYKVDSLTDVAVQNLLAQKHPHDLYVIDNGSPERYTNATVRVLRRRGGHDFAGGFNWGVERIGIENYDYIWHYTTDVVCSPDVLSSLTQQVGEKVAAIQPSMRSCHAHLNPRREGGCQTVRYVEWAAPLVSTAAWEDVGELDIGFPFFSNDIDWCYRARKKGWKFLVDYNVRCDHPGRGTFSRTNFDVASLSWTEHLYGSLKYGRSDWQEWLIRGGDLG